MALGVDIEDISRFKGKSPEFIDRVFTKLEQDYCMKYPNPESHFAVRFCAKEAVIKALAPFKIGGLSLNEIEIYHTEDKYPEIRILKKLEKNIKIQVSLSHDKTKAIAFVTAEEQ